MSNQNKGFDPLSSLFFELPGSSDEIPFEDDFGDIDERTAPIPAGHVEMTDPVFSPPPDMSLPLSGEVLEVTIHTDELSAEDARNIITPPIPDRPARRSALFRPPRPAVLDEPAGPSPAEQAQIAKAVAAAAIAKAQAAATAAPAPSAPAAEPSADQQAQIAKAVAAAAIAKAQAAAAAAPASAAPASAAPASAAPASAAPASAAPASAAPTDRLTGLSSRASRPMTALEAARAAATAEEQRRTTDLKREKLANAEKERLAIAKALAAAALEKAQAAAAPSEPATTPQVRASEPAASAQAAAALSPEEQARIARRLAMAALAQTTNEAKSAASDFSDEQAAIAKAVAAAAIARAQGTPLPEVSPAVDEKPKTRLEALAARAQRPRSALDAAREAAHQESKAAEERKAAEIRRKANALTDKIQALIPAWLPGVGTYYVANAIITNERDILKVLWKAHRAKFLSEGHLERAVGVASVLHALESAGQGELVAAHVVTDASDYLLWMDLGSDALVAAFADARAWFAPRD